jgi:hypothetical protein
MEIERDVTVELIHEDRDPKGNLRAAFSAGSRASGSLPAYSSTELEKGLGPLADRIQGLFAATSSRSQARAQALDARNVSGRPFGSPLPQKRFGS